MSSKEDTKSKILITDKDKSEGLHPDEKNITHKNPGKWTLAEKQHAFLPYLHSEVP